MSKNFDFKALSADLRRKIEATDSSELSHLLEFMCDIVDNVEYDIKAGRPKDAEIPEILRDHMLSCLDQFEDGVTHLRTYLKERVQ